MATATKTNAGSSTNMAADTAGTDGNAPHPGGPPQPATTTASTWTKYLPYVLIGALMIFIVWKFFIKKK